MTPAIEARALEKIFRARSAPVQALRGVDLDVHNGELVAIEGPSGSGKSTLLHILAGIDTADTGTVRLLGQQLDRMDDKGRTELRRRSVGLVLQRFDLLPTLSAAENIGIPGVLAGHRRKRIDTRVRAQLDELELTHRADHRPGELSGGEQQRVGLARALYHQPPILIADEPTGALDTSSGDEVLELLRRQSRTGRAVLIATHDPRASAHAHRSARLVDGHLYSGHCQ